MILVIAHNRDEPPKDMRHAYRILDGTP